MGLLCRLLGFTLKSYEISPDESKAFRQKDRTGHHKLLEMAEKDEKDFKKIADVIAGAVGLRFHPQFICELVNENFVAIRPDNSFAISTVGPALQVIESISLNAAGRKQMSELFPIIAQVEKSTRNFAAKVLGWFLRAWVERDAVSKFVSLFIPLEMVLENYNGKMDPNTERLAEEMHKLINTHAEAHKTELMKYFEHLLHLQKPSLKSRFEQLAKNAKLPCWEKDIIAFGRFNKDRNALVHRGDPSVHLHVDIGSEELQALEDLVERYVSYTLFGDSAVYQSQWRHVKKSVSVGS